MCHGQLIGSGLRLARKPKKCSECGKEIAPGDVYSRWAWASRGDGISEVRVHLRCHALLHEAAITSGETCIVGKAHAYMRDGINNTGGWRDLRRQLRDTLLLVLRRAGAGS